MRLDLASLRAAYLAREITPRDVVAEVLARGARHADNPIWISRVDEPALFARADSLAHADPASLPLYGVPFAIKDNIDLAGLPTTAACPDFSYQPVDSAEVVRKLLDAGAIALGKTNMDQFATGLVGTRSPYGIVRNAFDGQYLAGGSSSGSAVAVALGLASFALGTDTAGSGRVPAAFNNLVGYKPTLGRLSTRGMVPACRTIDAVSIFALTAQDAQRVAQVAAGFDAQDAWSREAGPVRGRGWSQRPAPRIGVPLRAQREFLGNVEHAWLFDAATARCEALGARLVEVDIAPLLQAARLLYEGPWIAERQLVAGRLLQADAGALHPATRQVIAGKGSISACDAFAARYRLQELAAAARPIWSAIDALLLPTVPAHFTIAEEQAEPLLRNSQLGLYTNFVNLLDLAATAVPAGFTQRGLPFGVTLVCPAWQDDDLLAFAARLHGAADVALGATNAPWPAESPAAAGPADTIDVAVCGAHMSGLPLNHQLVERGAWMVSATRTTREYRLYALPGGPPARPGLVRVGEGGAAIDIEVWRMPAEHFGTFMRGVPAPLGIGRVRIAGGSEVAGFVCESIATAAAEDISHHGGWRGWLARKIPP
jgi:allophanate hydrolase